jgi:hypothetical protein
MAAGAVYPTDPPDLLDLFDPPDLYNSRMRTLCWALIGLAAAAFVVGTTTAFSHSNFLLEPAGYWRGAVGFLLFAIAFRLMDSAK